jgi:hypothetical protein
MRSFAALTDARVQARAAAQGPESRMRARPVERPVVLAQEPAPQAVSPRVQAERCYRCRSRHSQPLGQN